MTDIRDRQFALVSPVSSGTNSLQTNQLAVIAVADPPPAPMRVNQFAFVAPAIAPSDLQLNQIAVILVVSPNSTVISPDRSIGLECWQPCLSYGTQAIVYWKET